METPNEENFKVVVRVRPLTQKEINQQALIAQKYVNLGSPMGDSLLAQHQNKGCVQIENDTLILSDLEFRGIDRKDKQFKFKSVYGQQNSNVEIFNQTVLPSLDFLIKGYSSTIFAYGMTGSGKTHTIFGDNISTPGICQLALISIVNKLSEFPNIQYQLRLSYIEIYNETVRDLLAEQQKSLLVVEDPVKGCVIVQDLSEYSVQNIQQIEELICQGNKRRVFCQTNANQFSSRSHAILQFSIEMKSQQSQQEQIITSKLTLIDLAGSEKVGHNENNSKGLQEGANINKSLLALGNCINILSDKSKKSSFVPYRDSKLTRLLKECLRGNSKTTMIVCISPSFSCYEETLNTLNYANRAQQIKSKVHKNIKEISYQQDQKSKEIIDDLQQQLSILQQILRQPAVCSQCQHIYVNQNLPSGESKIHSLDIHKQKIEMLKQEEKNLRQEIVIIEQNIKQIQTQQPNLNILDNKEEYIERICNDLSNNIEENYEIKLSLKELNEIINLNNEQIQEELFNVSNFKMSYNKNESEEKLYLLRQNTIENEQIKIKLTETLNVNINQRLFMKKLLAKVSENTKLQNFLEEIQLKNQQVHNILLILQNYEQLTQIFEKDKLLKEQNDLIKQLQEKKLDNNLNDSSRRSSNVSLSSQLSKEISSKSEKINQMMKTPQDKQNLSTTFKKPKSPLNFDQALIQPSNFQSPTNFQNQQKPLLTLQIRSPQPKLQKSPQQIILSGVKDRLRSESSKRDKNIFHSQCEQIHQNKQNKQYSSLLSQSNQQSHKYSIDSFNLQQTSSPSLVNSNYTQSSSMQDNIKNSTKLKSPQVATIQLYDNNEDSLFNKFNNKNNFVKKIKDSSQSYSLPQDSQNENIFSITNLQNNFFKVDQFENIYQKTRSRNTSQSNRYNQSQEQIIYSEFTLQNYVDYPKNDNIYGSIILKESTQDYKNKLMSPFYKQDDQTHNMSDSVVLTSNQSSDQKLFKNKENFDKNYEPFADLLKKDFHNETRDSAKNFSLIGSPVIEKTSKTLYAQQNFINPYTRQRDHY